jgi:hypothetical protein
MRSIVRFGKRQRAVQGLPLPYQSRGLPLEPGFARKGAQFADQLDVGTTQPVRRNSPGKERKEHAVFRWRFIDDW